MRILIAESNNATTLLNAFKDTISEHAIWEYVTADILKEEEYQSFNIESPLYPIICIEEDSISFKDVLAQWNDMTKDEISALLFSLVPMESEWWKSCPSGWCGGCSWC